MADTQGNPPGQRKPDERPVQSGQLFPAADSQETRAVFPTCEPGEQLRHVLTLAARAGARTFYWPLTELEGHVAFGAGPDALAVCLPRGPDRWLAPPRGYTLPHGVAPPSPQVLPQRVPLWKRIKHADTLTEAESRSLALLLALPHDAAADRLDALEKLPRTAGRALTVAASLDVVGVSRDAILDYMDGVDREGRTLRDSKRMRIDRDLKRGRKLWNAIGAWPWRQVAGDGDPWHDEARPAVEHDFRRVLSEAGLWPMPCTCGPLD